MIKYELTGRNFEIDDKMREYVEEKICSLDKYLPKNARGTATCAVVLEDDPSGREDNRFVCEAVLYLAGSQLVSREGTVNVYAAIDIVQAKLKPQLSKYKQLHTTQPRRLRMLSRLSWRKSVPEIETPEQDAV